MNTFNTITIVGRLGKDVEVKQAGGTSVARLSLATTRSYKKQGATEWEKETHWHNVAAWGFLADRSKEYKKGDIIIVQGDLRYNKYVDANGVEKTNVEIFASAISMGEKYKASDRPYPNNGYQPNSSPAQPSAPVDPFANMDTNPFSTDPDLPF